MPPPKSPTKSRPTIVFDLDGTLVDTAPDLVATLNHILTREGLGPLPYDAARNMVGRGARAMIESGLKASGCMLPAVEVNRLEHDFIDHYVANIAVHSQPFAEVEAILGLPTTAIGWRFAPISLNGCRSGCLTRLGFQGASSLFAGPTRLARQNRTLKFFLERSAGPEAAAISPSWWEIRSPTFRPRVQPQYPS